MVLSLEALIGILGNSRDRGQPPQPLHKTTPILAWLYSSDAFLSAIHYLRKKRLLAQQKIVYVTQSYVRGHPPLPRPHSLASQTLSLREGLASETIVPRLSLFSAQFLRMTFEPPSKAEGEPGISSHVSDVRVDTFLR